MLSLNCVINFLKEIDDSKIIIKSDKKEIINNNIIENEISNNNNNNEINKNNIIRFLPESFNIIFNNDIKKYYIENKLSRYHKNKTSIFTFINSIFMIIYPEYILFSDTEKESNIKTFLKKISDELFENNLYQKFLYNTNRKINKSNLQEILAKSFTFKYDESLFPILQQYIVDYFGINIFILCLNNNNIDFMNSYYVLSSYFKIKNNPFLPSLFLIKDNDIFKPLLSNNETDNDITYFAYSKNRTIIENIWKYFKLNDIDDCIIELKEDDEKNEEIKNNLDLTKLKKLKVDELKEICIKYEISLTKISDKTSKVINKTKTELIEDIEFYIKSV